MKLCKLLLIPPVALIAAPLFAQPQIGGGICSSASLSGSYSVTLSGRDVSSSLSFSKVDLGIGTATFDGLSKVTLSLVAATVQASGIVQTLSGTYTMQANCIGSISITTGDTATFSVEPTTPARAICFPARTGLTPSREAARSYPRPAQPAL